MPLTKIMRKMLAAMKWISEKHPFEPEAQNHYLTLFQVLRMWGATEGEIDQWLKEMDK